MANYNVDAINDETGQELNFEIETQIENLTITSTIVQNGFMNDMRVIVNADKPYSLISEDGKVSIESLLEVSFNFVVRDGQIVDNTKDVTFYVSEASNRSVAKAILDAVIDSGAYSEFEVSC